MNFTFVQGRVALPEGFEDLVRNRLAFALDRFASRVRSITVRMDDVNGPRGGADKRCRVLVHVRGLPEIFVEDLASDAQESLDCAVHKARAAIARSIQRQRSNHGPAAPDELRSTAER